MKASDLFVKALENEGVSQIFAVPGEENLDLVESIRQSSIELVVVRHEQGAGFMAATFGRLTGKTGVCLATLGPGACNLVTAAAYAQLGGMPMLMITGQKPVKQSKQGRFQIIDVVEMMKPITKFTKQIVNGHTIPALIRESFKIAEHERPGAVHLELPEDIAEEDAQSPIFTINESFRASPNDDAINKAVTMIEAATRPLVLIGAGANRKEITTSLKTFIDKLGLPFFTTQMGKGVLDERCELALGTAALSDGDYIHCAIRRADLILNIGHDIVEKPPFLMHESGPRVIHLNYSPSHTDDVYFPELDIIGDLTASLNKLTLATEKQAHWDFSPYLQIRDALLAEIHQASEDQGFPFLPQRLVNDVRKAMPEQSIIALDNGMYKIWFARNYPAYHPNTVLLDNALATMGAGVPQAMAASMLHPDKPVMAICGDGGFMMNSHQLEPAVRLKAHFIVLVLKDDGYGMIKWKQQNMNLTNFGLDFNNPDFVKYAESYGATGHRIAKCGDLIETIQACIANPGVHLIEVPVDYSKNSYFLGENLSKKTSAF